MNDSTQGPALRAGGLHFKIQAVAVGVAARLAQVANRYRRERPLRVTAHVLAHDLPHNVPLIFLRMERNWAGRKRTIGRSNARKISVFWTT